MKEILDLNGKVAIVTGATKGRGYGMALKLANHGASIVVASRTIEDCKKVADEIECMGKKALSCPTDVSKKVKLINLLKILLKSSVK